MMLAPWFKRFDVGAAKRFGTGGSTNIELRFDMLNVFDTPNFSPIANPGNGATIFRVTAAYTDASNTYDPGGRIGQLTFRFNASGVAPPHSRRASPHACLPVHVRTGADQR